MAVRSTPSAVHMSVLIEKDVDAVNVFVEIAFTSEIYTVLCLLSFQFRIVSCILVGIENSLSGWNAIGTIQCVFVFLLIFGNCINFKPRNTF